MLASWFHSILLTVSIFINIISWIFFWLPNFPFFCAESGAITNLLRFILKQSECKKFVYWTILKKLKIKFVLEVLKNVKKKNKKNIIVYFPFALFSKPIMLYPILNCIRNFKRSRQCLHNREQIQTCFVFMLKQCPGGYFKFPISVKFHPYSMFSNVTTFWLSMKTIALIM